MKATHMISRLFSLCLVSIACLSAQPQLYAQTLTPQLNLKDIEQEVVERAQSASCSQCASITQFKISSFDPSSGKIVIDMSVSASKRTVLDTPLNLIDLDILAVKKNNTPYSGVQVSAQNYLSLLLSPNAGESGLNFTVEAQLHTGVQSTSLQNFKNYVDLSLVKDQIVLENVSNQEKVLRFQSVVLPKEGNKNSSNKTLPIQSNLSIMPQVAIERQLSLSNHIQLSTVITTTNTNSKIDPIQLSLEKLQGEDLIKGRNYSQDKTLHIDYIPGTRVELESQLNLSQFTLKNTTPYVQKIVLKQDSTWDVSFNLAPTVKNRTESIWWLLPEESLQVQVQKLLAAPGSAIAIENSVLKADYGYAKPKFTQNFSIVSSMGAKVLLDKRHIALYEIEKVMLNHQKIEIDAQNKTSLYPLILAPGDNQLEVVFNAPSDKTSVISAQPFLKVVSDAQKELPARNATTQITNFQNKWLLWSWGADFKPSILLWGLVLVIGAASYVLGGWVPALGLGTLSWFLLMTGLTQSGIAAIVWTVIWFGLLAIRRQHSRFPLFEKPLFFNTYQIALVLIGLAVFSSFFDSVSSGLLGNAQIFIAGPQSSTAELYFYSQNFNNTATVFWLPVWCYRTLMFIWSIWLAFKAVGWVKLAWEAYSQDGLWKSALPIAKVVPTNPAATDLPAANVQPVDKK